MTVKISHTADIQAFNKPAGLDHAEGNPRLKQHHLRVLQDTARLSRPGNHRRRILARRRLPQPPGRPWRGRPAGGRLGIEHFLDLLQDAKDAEAGRRRHAAPSKARCTWPVPAGPGEARMDDSEPGGDVPQGQVFDADGKPLAGATVDLWHANTRAPIRTSTRASPSTTCAGASSPMPKAATARAIVPSGYGCDPQGPTQECLDLLGRHGQRPAHIHFFISAPGTVT
jgi:catechol 1,2-dioxygenase